MFNKQEIEKKQAEIVSIISDIDKLKKVIGSEDMEIEKRMNSDSWFWGTLLPPRTLFVRIETLEENLQELSNKFNVLLKHFGIEYVEITEKNGGTHTTQKYRPIKNKKK